LERTTLEAWIVLMAYLAFIQIYHSTKFGIVVRIPAKTYKVPEYIKLVVKLSFLA